MSTKKLQVGDDTFDYPITGTNNYGEEASSWAEAVSEALTEVKGPGDISTTETLLVNGTTGFVSGLQFDTAFVQRIVVEGIITREYTVASGKSREVEEFEVKGAYNGTEFNISLDYTGDDTEVDLFMVGGQFKYTSADVLDTLELKIKFKAKVLVDEDALP
jgi:hypothetical protein